MGKFKVSLGFCAAVCILAWLDLSLCGSFLLCGLCHELGHLIALRLCRIPVEKIMVGTVGAVICARFSDYSRELICAAAGPAAGMILAGALFRCAPKVALVSVLLSAVNLLPLYPLDGGRMLRAVLGLCCRPQTTERVTHIAAAATCCVLMVLACWGTVYFKMGLWPIFAALVLLWRVADRE